jgi:hypothetical protein
MSRKDHPDWSRRDLLSAGGAAAFGGLLGGCTPGYGNSGGKQADEGTGISRRAKRQPNAMDSSIAHENLQADVVVVGGGIAGVCAALAAARNGISVILVQDRPVLGGNASSEIGLHIMGADDGGLRNDTDARESGIIEELRLDDAVRNPQEAVSMHDLLLYDKVRSEPNIHLLLNTSCCGVQMGTERRIREVLATCPQSEKHFKIEGKVFIDCSGDGRLGIEAGVKYRVGREARSEFNEPMAPPQADHKVLGSSILFTARKHDRPIPFVAPSWVHKFKDCSELPHRRHHQWGWGYWWIEWGGELDTIKDDARIREELLAAALGVWDHIKNSGRHPDSENWALDWLGFLPGKRESRRFVGDYVLTQHDVQGGKVFEDGVAYGGWPIDLHPPKGIYSSKPPCDQTRVPLYNIPFRCLYSRNVKNLLFAGRNISASHVAFGSTRVMGTGSVMGQAVGTAAAMCVRNKVLPREFGRSGVSELQQQLLKDGSYIIGVSNFDPQDMALGAEARASSQTPEEPAANVVDGIARRVGKHSHAWISDPQQKMPQWVEVKFDKPQRVREVHLTFDTALSRPLTLTKADYVSRRMVHGPQPETVRDYKLELISGKSRRTVAEVQGNYQQKVVHRFEPDEATGIRVLVQGTHGDPSARLFEIRAYE